VRPRAGDRRKIEPGLLGHAARQRAGENTSRLIAPIATVADGCRCGWLSGAVAGGGRRAGFGLYGRLRRRRGRWGGGSVHGRGILAFLEQHGDHRVDRNALAPFGHHDLTDGPLFDSLDFHRRLVGFDLRDDIAGRRARLRSSSVKAPA
jgi:hypothetical protein